MAKRNEDLGRRIAEARHLKGMKQKELARAVSVEPVTVSRWERGENNPDLGKLELIAAALDRPVSYFVTATPGRQEELVGQFGDVVGLAVDGLRRQLVGSLADWTVHLREVSERVAANSEAIHDLVVHQRAAEQRLEERIRSLEAHLGEAKPGRRGSGRGRGSL